MPCGKVDCGQVDRRHSFLAPLSAGTLIALSLICLIATGAEAQTRRLPGGRVIPPERIIENHPAALSRRPLPLALVKHKWAANQFYCHLINDDSSLGRVTFYSLLHAAEGDYPFSSTRTGFSEARLRAAAGSDAIVDLFMEYALKEAKGDLDKARAIVAQAKQHDARCFIELARNAKNSIALLRQGLDLVFGENGQWLVVQVPPQSIAQLVAFSGEDVKWASYFVKRAEVVYEGVERELLARTVKPERPQQGPRKEEGRKDPVRENSKQETRPIAEVKPVTFKDAQTELTDALQKIREFCLTLANAKCS